ncbi:MAG: amidohydrolase family protein [Bacteroidota bacterium]
MNYSPYLLLLACVGMFLSCQPDSTGGGTTQIQSGDMAFVHVNVVPMNQERILRDQTVVIKHGKIHQIGDANSIQLSRETVLIDGTDQYLSPGLSEMHAHIPVPRQGDDTVRIMSSPLFLYLANGITIIRGMLGHPYHLDLKELVMNGEIPGPRIYTSGTSINGNTAPDPETAAQLVRDQQATGYDFLKLHPGLTTETFDAIVRTAKEVGIPYAGHVSNLVRIEHALANDYASIDHIDGFLEGLVPESAGVDHTKNGFFGFNFVELAEPAGIDALAQSAAENEIAIVPTQSVIIRWTSAKSPEDMAAEPEMKYIHPRLLASWQERKHGLQGLEDYSPARAEKFENLRAQIIKALHDAGTLMLLGSDSPQVFNVPGFSIHHEIQLLATAGLSNFEAMQTGTVNPAKYFGEEGEYGVVAEGASADLVLLKGNPLEDLTHLEHPNGVMYRGNWLSRPEIEKGLQELADHYASLASN